MIAASQRVNMTSKLSWTHPDTQNLRTHDSKHIIETMLLFRTVGHVQIDDTAVHVQAKTLHGRTMTGQSDVLFPRAVSAMITARIIQRRVVTECCMMTTCAHMFIL